MSLPMRGAWIEILNPLSSAVLYMSLPMRGAWIEICAWKCHCWHPESLPMRGAWIEMHLALRFSHHWQCRSPCGERGLKSPRKCLVCGKELSLPMRGAWIEIHLRRFYHIVARVAPHAGSVDLKYAEAVKRPSQGMYWDGRWCISGVIPYLTAIGGRYAVQYSRKRDD